MGRFGSKKRNTAHPRSTHTTGANLTAAGPELAPDAQALLNLQQMAGNRAALGALPFQRDLERSFGRDLNGVKVHTGVRALLQQGAAAATVGDTMVFAQQHPPKEIVAHEAAHVLQNRNGGGHPLPTGLAPEGGNAEAEADRAGEAAAAGQAAVVTGGSGGAVAHWNPFKKLLNKKPKIKHTGTGGKMSAAQQGGVMSMAQLMDMEAKRQAQQNAASINAFEGNALPEVGGGKTDDFQMLKDESGASGSYWAMEGGQRKGIFKPASQELDTTPEGGYKQGGGAIREVLGYDLSKKLGGNVPATRMMGATSTEFTKINEGKSDDERRDPSRTQVGSYQELAANLGNLADVVENKKGARDKMNTPGQFDVDSLQKMAIQDIISMNTDRHAGNILVDQSGKLIPIDHGQVMPGKGLAGNKFGSMFGGDQFWAWSGLKGADQGFSKENKELIAGLKGKELVSDLKAKAEARAQAAGMSDTTITDNDWQMMQLSTSTLKKAARAGLTPQQLGGLYQKGTKLSEKEKTNFAERNPDRLMPERNPGEISAYLRSTKKVDDPEEFKRGWKGAEAEGLRRILGDEAYEKFAKSESERKLMKQLARHPMLDRAQQMAAPDNGPVADDEWGDSGPMDYGQLLEMLEKGNK